jgi:tetratricopeptide (TPR) repeat protein
LRLLDRRAFVGFPPLSLWPGATISDFALQIPNVSFPFNITGGALRYQRQRLSFGLLELSVDAEWIVRQFANALRKLTDLEGLQIQFRAGYLEAHGRLSTPDRVPFTFKVGFDAEGEHLVALAYDVRLYQFAPLPATQIPVILARFLEEVRILPELQRRGASGFRTRILPWLVRSAALSRGFRMPSLENARLSSIDVNSQGLKIRFSSGGLPPTPRADDSFLLSLEGSRAFSDAEELIAQGQLLEAREIYPFAAERLLALLVADPRAHELAMDVAGSLAKRGEGSAAALWTEAIVREGRGERARAAERYLALCAHARKAGEEFSAFFAAEAAARAAGEHVPQLAVRALHELLGVKPDHLPSLQALARASDLAGDRGGAIRSYRRIAALARDPIDSANAHVQLARLCSETEDDIAGARLHCEAALRLAPDHIEALEQLGQLCFQSGEHLRAIKAADRVREIALSRHELELVGRANLFAGKVWEIGLQQHENALLRYREACALLPTAPEPPYLRARSSERSGRLQEALAGYQQAVELAGPSPESDEARTAAHESRHALARLSHRLGDPAKARHHLEAALALDPRDREALDQLIPYFRVAGRTAELADACEKAAALDGDSKHRAELLAEAGELHRTRLGSPEKADQLVSTALELNPGNRIALEGLLALAESQRDGMRIARSLKTLAQLSSDPKERARYYRRLSVVARDLTFDSQLAAQSLSEVLSLEPGDLPALAELCTLQRKRGDMDGLSAALEQRARAAEEVGDGRLAANALREQSQVLETRLGRVGEAFFAIEKASRLSAEPEVLLEYAEMALRCDRPEHARRAFEAVLSSIPNQAPERIAEIRAKIATACDKLGDREGAKANYAQAFPFRPVDREIVSRLESLYLEGAQLPQLAELWATSANALLASQRPLEAAPLFLKCAEALLQLEETGAALVQLNAALDANPTGPLAADILGRMAELHLQRAEPLEAAKLLTRRASAAGDPQNRAGLLVRAASLVRGFPEEEPLLAQAIEHYPQSVAARMRRAELLGESDPWGAFADLEAAFEVPLSSPDAVAGEDRIDLARKAAFAALNAGLTDAAHRYLELCLAHRPTDQQVKSQLAELYRRTGAKVELLSLLEGFWEQLDGEERLRACREWAELCIQLEGPTRCIEALRKLRKLNAGDLWAAGQLLRILPDPLTDASGDEERAQILSTLIDQAQGEERGSLLSDRAHLHRRAGRLNPARLDLAEAARCKPSLASFEELAEVARTLGDEAGELEALEEAVALDASVGAKLAGRLIALAQAQLAKGELDRARTAFEAATRLQLSPIERCDAFVGLAAASASVPAATSALYEASRQGPVDKRIAALLRRAAMMGEQGDLTGAGESYEGVLTLAPRHAGAIAGLKQTLQATGDWPGLADVLATEAAQAPKERSGALYAELGALYLERLGRRGPAEAALKKAAQLDVRNISVRRSLLALLAEKGELVKAIELLEEGARATSAEEGAALLREGVGRAIGSGESQLALRLARSAHQLSPASGDALQELTELLYVQGAIQEALPLQEKLAQEADFENFPERAEERLRLADLAEQLGDLQLAEGSLWTVKAQRPLSRAAAERLSRLLQRDRPREAIEVLGQYARELAPSETRVDLLASLSQRARTELADVELASSFLKWAIENAGDPLPIHLRLAALYREAGRTGELLEELRTVAGLTRNSADWTGTLKSLEEQAQLCEQSGRVDEALHTLESIRNLHQERGLHEAAAKTDLQRAILLAERKADLRAAASALEGGFQLHSSLEIAQLGAALARRQEDASGEAQWIERSLPLYASGSAAATAWMRLAELCLEPLGAADRGERALREALKCDPQLQPARLRLRKLLEDTGQFEPLAAHLREEATRASELGARVELLREAAQIYRGRLQDSQRAASCLLEARSLNPGDPGLSAEVSDLLHQLGRTSEAAELDAELLRHNPLHAGVFDRHLAFLGNRQDDGALAALLIRRAELSEGASAAKEYLRAAESLRRVADEGRAVWCEEQAFRKDPENHRAFEAVRSRSASDPRRLAEVLATRAEAVPAQAVELLRQRAHSLLDAHEELLAAEALDDLLEQVPDDVEALLARADLAAQSGGPVAAQPLDRRLLSVGKHLLSIEIQSKAYLRLGRASLSVGALKDAADALEAMLELESEGDRVREALALLAEVYGRADDAKGLYRVTLQQAKMTSADEAEALYRRAADLAAEPQDAVEALLALARRHPTDAQIVDRAGRGLAALGRFRELLELNVLSAEATGGSIAAERLEEAAEIALGRLSEKTEAARLQREAAMIYLRIGQPSKAATLFASAVNDASDESGGTHTVDAAEAWEAAGNLAEAVALTERVALQHPKLFSPLELSQRFARLGAPKLAAQYGFEPLMSAGQLEKALELADKAQDATAMRRALWVLSEQRTDPRYPTQLAPLLQAEGSFEELMQLAQSCDRGGQLGAAVDAYRRLFRASDQMTLRAAALDRLLALGAGESEVVEAIGSLDEKSPKDLVLLLLDRARGLGGEWYARAMKHAAALEPARQEEMLRELLALEMKEQRLERAVHTIGRLAEIERNPTAKAAGYLQQGELFLKLLQPLEAREAFERSLLEDPVSIAAAKRLFELEPNPAHAEHFATLAEQVLERHGPAAIEAEREALADAYEGLGRKAKAYLLLSQLEETPARLRRRAALADDLGLFGESLQLQERLTDDPVELEKILMGYLQANLIPFAARLGERLLERQPLSSKTRRWMAERFAPSKESSALAVKIWPSLLREQVLDADGWTLCAEALRQLDRTAAAQLADGFGAALSSSSAAAGMVPVRPISPSSNTADWPQRPPGILEITGESMPRLHGALSQVVRSLAGETRMFLDPSGGVEAYLLARDELLLGAGALSCFGPAELSYLCALAVALGSHGHLVSRPGAVEDWEHAVCVAFESVQGSLAAARVLAQLDERVRGTNPALVQTGQVLRNNRSFRAMAVRALDLL